VSLPLIGLIPLGEWIAEKAANVKAVNEYLTQAFPSQSACSRIQDNFKATRLLINKKGDVNKLDEEGHSLLGSICFPSLDVFKLLVSHGIDIKGVGRYEESCFQRAVENENPAYLEFILKNNLIKTEDFDSA